MELLIIVPIIILIYFLKGYTRTFKGIYGESIVSINLGFLNADEYKVLNDLFFKTPWGTSQIDHIVISPFGIFVIETKNYKGWIFGHENSEYWSQINFKKKSKFKNPIKQNWVHVNALKVILSNYPSLKYHPIVVFAGNAKLKKITSKMPVVYASNIVRYIKSKNEMKCLSINEMNEIFNILNRLNIKEGRTNIPKNRPVKEFSGKNEKSFVCPKCGGKLIERNGKFGTFYGCSNFPKCRHTQNNK